jgi:ABC-type sugar transport system permease subunit
MKRTNEWSTAVQFLALPLFIYAAILIFPYLWTVYFSFTDWNGISADYNLVGLKNYLNIFSDRGFSQAFWHNLLWIAIFLTVPTSLGLLLAILLDKKPVGASLFKTIFYFPMVLSYVIVGMIWTFVYEPRLGILNLALRGIGLGELSTAWLAEPNTALLSIIVAASWQHVGLCMVLFLAGLATIREELIEAAQIDGCTTWQLYSRIIIPQLKHVTVVVISLTVVLALKNFDIVYITTKGGPHRASEILTTFMFRQAFWNYRMGYASAVANILFLLVIVVIAVYMRQVLRTSER